MTNALKMLPLLFAVACGGEVGDSLTTDTSENLVAATADPPGIATLNSSVVSTTAGFEKIRLHEAAAGHEREPHGDHGLGDDHERR